MYNRTPYNRAPYNRKARFVFEWTATANVESGSGDGRDGTRPRPR